MELLERAEGSKGWAGGNAGLQPRDEEAAFCYCLGVWT